MISVLFQFDRYISNDYLTTNMNEKEIRKKELSYDMYTIKRYFVVSSIVQV